MKIRYAGFWIRCLAHIIDTVITEAAGLLVTLMLLGVFYLLGGVHETFWNAYNSLYVQIVEGVVGLGIVIPYYVIGHFRYGTTLGKRLFRIYVVDAKTLKPISLRQSWIRCFAYVVSYLPIGVGFLMVAFQPRKQALHDLIAGTVSIRKDREPKAVSAGIEMNVFRALAMILVLFSAGQSTWVRADEDEAGPVEAPNWSQEILASYVTQQSDEFGGEIQVALLYHPSAIHALHYGAHIGVHHAFAAPDGPRTEFVGGGAAEFWVLNAMGPGFAADTLVQDTVRGRYEPYYGARFFHLGRAGAWGVRIGVPWDAQYHWGFRVGATFEIGGIH